MEHWVARGVCWQWEPYLLWLHTSGNALVALSYFSIPISLMWVYKRAAHPARPILMLFIAFIAMCGLGHVMALTVIYRGGVWVLVEGWVRVATGVVSIATAAYLALLVRRGMTLLADIRAMLPALRNEATAAVLDALLLRLNRILE